MIILETEKLTKTFTPKLGKKKKIALDSLSLTLNQGSVFGFVGPNGAGKSTTIKLVMGFMKPTSGWSRIAGHSSQDVESRIRVGYLPENPHYYDFLSGIELLEMSAKIHGIHGAACRRKIEHALEQVDLTESGNRSIRTYSKGMLQRLGIANSMIGDPDILIWDEPMSGLDPIGRNLVSKLMLDMKEQGKTIFFSSHILHDVETICDEVGIILHGKLQFQGQLKNILSASQFYELRFSVPCSKKIEQLLLYPEITFSLLADGIVEILIGRDVLSSQVRHLLAEGGELISLEPQRHTLEEYFMEMLHTSPSDFS